MINKCIAILFAVVSSVAAANGQVVEKTFYLDSCENFTNEEKYTFRRVTKSIAGKPFEYELADYDRQGNLYTSGTTKSRNGVTKEGIYTYYRKDGTVWARGEYEKGVPVNTWVYYSKSGKEVSIDSLMSEAGVVRSEKDGFYREGKCISYMLNGDVIEVTAAKEKAVRTYRAGIVIATNGVVVRPDKPASFIPDMKAFYSYIEEKMTYPIITRLAAREGEVYAKFVVTKEGSVTEVTFLRSLDNPTKKKITKVLTESSGLWKPAEFEGKKVGSYLILPVIFKLQR